MIPKDPNFSFSSSNRRELVNMACACAASRNPQDHALLLRYLGSGDFLNRLNTEEEYLRFPARKLDVARIIKTLMDQETAEARGTLVGLTESQPWQTIDPLIELLIRGLAADRPASPQTVAFWDRHSQPDSVYLNIVIEALFINRSEPALKLFEQKLNDPNHETEYKEIWLRREMLRRRNDLPVLQCCERMIIEGSVDEAWHQNILEALFDFREAWYLSHHLPRPPLRVLAPDASKEILGRIGRHALTQMELTFPGLWMKIKLAMKEISHDQEADGGPEKGSAEKPPG